MYQTSAQRPLFPQRARFLCSMLAGDRLLPLKLWFLSKRKLNRKTEHFWLGCTKNVFSQFILKDQLSFNGFTFHPTERSVVKRPRPDVHQPKEEDARPAKPNLFFHQRSYTRVSASWRGPFIKLNEDAVYDITRFVVSQTMNAIISHIYIMKSKSLLDVR